MVDIVNNSIWTYRIMTCQAIKSIINKLWMGYWFLLEETEKHNTYFAVVDTILPDVGFSFSKSCPALTVFSLVLLSIFTLFLWSWTVYAGRHYVHLYVRSSMCPLTKFTSMYCQQTTGPKSSNFCTHAYWQGTFACQFSSKSSISLTFNFKVKDLNRMHWQVHTWNQREMRSSIYQTLHRVSDL